MSVRPADIQFPTGFSQAKIESEQLRQRGSGPSFKDTLAASVSRKGAAGDSGRLAADGAEMLHLEMMRNALSLDGSPKPPAFDAGRMEAFLAAYTVHGQQIDAASQSPVSPASTGNGGAVSPMDSDGPTAHGNGVDLSIAAMINRASRRYGVEENLIMAVIKVESNFKATAVSPAGAQGLMQLMPATAAGLGVADPFNPEQNIMGGTRFLKEMLSRYDGDVDKALAAYNWGPGNLDRMKGHLPRETRDYLARVKKIYADSSVA